MASVHRFRFDVHPEPGNGYDLYESPNGLKDRLQIRLV
jgi:hypothetical protein